MTMDRRHLYYHTAMSEPVETVAQQYPMMLAPMMMPQYFHGEPAPYSHQLRSEITPPSVLQTLLRREDEYPTMQMDLSPSTSNGGMPVTMLNVQSRGGLSQQQTAQHFVAIKNEPAQYIKNEQTYMVNNNNNNNEGCNGSATKVCSKFDVNPNSNSFDDKPYICSACKSRIIDRFLLMADNKYWHYACLKCNECNCELTEKNEKLFVKNSKIYCRQDYRRLFGVQGTCSACSKVIPPLDMIMRAGGNIYHLNCFACQECTYRFEVGEKFYFDTDNNKILCEKDYIERLYFAGLSNNSPFYLAQLKRQISYQVDDIDEISPMQR